MRKSIKKLVGIRVAAALASVLLFSFVTTYNIFRIQNIQADNAQANVLLDKAQKAEVAHYKWASNLSNALYAGMEFTGSIDPTTCVLGQWLYGEANTDDETVLSLRSQLEPLHKQLHASATEALNMTSKTGAQEFFQNSIQSNLSTLVGLLDQVVDRGTAISQESEVRIERTIVTMHLTCAFCLALALICLLSLVQYVLRHVVKSIIKITASSKPLQEGRLELDLDFTAEDELGGLADTLRQSMGHIHNYVADINRIMGQLSQGNFDVHTSTPFIGDFRSIEASIESLTTNLSGTLDQFGHA